MAHSTLPLPDLAENTLPIIDLTPLRSGTASERASVSHRIGEACEKIGFFYVRNHGVPATTVEAALEASRRFFALPEQDKRAVVRERGRYRGYISTMPFTRDESTGEAFLYEAFIVGDDVAEDDLRVRTTDGLYGPNRWPAALPAAATGMRPYRDALHRLCGQLLEALALALGQPEATFARHFTRPLTNLSFLHYPPRKRSDGCENARAHFDSDVFTILLPSDVGGLEVWHQDGHWVKAAPLPGCFVINTGNMMETWSGGRFRSTLHRVHPPVGRHRYSIGYFAHPDYDTVVEPLPGLPVALPQGKPHRIDSGEDLRRFVSQFDDE